MRSPHLAHLAGFLFLLAVALTPLRAAGDSAQSPAKPNIIFIMTDQQFGDAMSCRMGAQYLHTPAMDSLAQDGMLFTRAYAANPICMPARNSIFTGRYPHETGITKNMGSQLDPAEFVDMGAYFRQAGYQTAYYGKRHLWFDVDKSFESSGNSSKKEHDVQTTASAVEFLSRKHDQPFLLVVSLVNPHNVCELARGQALPSGPIGDPPPPDQCPPAPVNLAPQLNEPDAITIMADGYHASSTFPVGKFTADQWRQLRWGYYRLIERVDAQIGQVLAALHQSGLEDNTLVVFTADHGECAGAHGWNQKTIFYEESARVPCIIRFHGKTKPGTSDRLVNIGVDALPTLLDFAELPQPAKLPGRSLRPLALGQPVTAWRDHIVIEDNFGQADPITTWSNALHREIIVAVDEKEQAALAGKFVPTTEGRMVRTERYKYCVYSCGQQRESLVDLEKDPGETRNVAADPEYQKILLEHRALLEKFGREHHDPLAATLLADNVKPIPFKTLPKNEQEKGRGKEK